jgi:hypothetical protein
VRESFHCRAFAAAAGNFSFRRADFEVELQQFNGASTTGLRRILESLGIAL